MHTSTILGSMDGAVNKLDKNPCPQEVHVQMATYLKVNLVLIQNFLNLTD
jgi:hypothetical protein